MSTGTIAFRMGQRARTQDKPSAANAFAFRPYPTTPMQTLTNEVWTMWLAGWMRQDFDLTHPINAKAT